MARCVDCRTYKVISPAFQDPPPYEYDSPPTTDTQPASTASGSSFPGAPQTPSTSSHPPASSSVPADLSPANFLHIHEQNGSVRGRYLLDLRLPRPPAGFLPEGPSAENIKLESNNGAVTAEVWVVGSEARAHACDYKTGPARARLTFFSRNGAVRAKVHMPASETPRVFLTINVHSRNGSTSLTIPRDFRGQLTAHTDNGRVSLSSELAARTATLSTAGGTHTYFVGQRPASNSWVTGDGKGPGDSVDDAALWTKNGSVSVRYADEDEGVSFWSSLLKPLGL
ncbi:hypothetical protein FA95DRAFT_935105 [Auriscalpium vulgare]|uniref:Uncharacterized protein n=1 Tax=Auriscalpium vulgare TaxID=40419 RepID=A0ACB8SAI3_9AGAM|nr:hypothetical protein FA95DRAFT_935105 [Auriscalpium vulgare]